MSAMLSLYSIYIYLRYIQIFVNKQQIGVLAGGNGTDLIVHTDGTRRVDGAAAQAVSKSMPKRSKFLNSVNRSVMEAAMVPSSSTA